MDEKRAAASEIGVYIVDHVAVADHLALYRDAGWWDADQDPAVLERIVAGSFLVAAAVTGDGRFVGMGRMISDGVADGYIQDVAVLSGYRGCGLGARIVRTLADEGLRRGLRWIGLISAPGTLGFYERLGFATMPGHTPMLLKVPVPGGDCR